MDFKGHFPIGAQHCHPLTMLDDHWYYNLVQAACGNDERGPTVQTALERAFARYGLPRRINTDNGAPWGTMGPEGLTGLEVWLIGLGIALPHNRRGAVDADASATLSSQHTLDARCVSAH